jgi:hypothetical protein
MTDLIVLYGPDHGNRLKLPGAELLLARWRRAGVGITMSVRVELSTRVGLVRPTESLGGLRAKHTNCRY